MPKFDMERFEKETLERFTQRKSPKGVGNQIIDALRNAIPKRKKKV